MSELLFDLQRFVDITNSKSNTLINGTSGDDSIDNQGWNVTIKAGKGNDSIYNDDSDYVTIDGGTGDDYIESTSDNSSIAGGTGNDYIINNGTKVTIDAGDGDDVIDNDSFGSYTSINGGKGDDTINNFNENVTITAGAGDDSIYNGVDGSQVKIAGGDGHDNIDNDSSDVTISGGSGNDTIHNGGGYSSVAGGDGNDSIENDGTIATINAGNGDDTVDNYGASVTISGGEGDDYIYNGHDADSVKIFGGAGNDSVLNDGDSVTINAGAGNDSIRNDSGENVLIQYKSGDGNDVIQGFNETATLSIGGGTYSTKQSGSDIIVKVGKGKITLVGAATLERVNIKGTASSNSKLITLTEGNDTYYNTVEGATINALAGNDYINAGFDSVTVNAGAGNDSILVDGALAKWLYKIVINGDAGNDSIVNYDMNVTLNGGAGDDTITNTRPNVTLNGGTGNDLISLHSYAENNLIQYSMGDGNDSIIGFNADDTLSISGGEYSTTKSGKNIIVTVGGDKITLAGAAKLSTVNIKGTKTATNSWRLSGTTATYGTSSNTLITVKGVKSLDGISLSGKVVTVAAAALNKSKVTISNGYTLKLADDVSTSAKIKTAWSYKSSVATLSQTKGAYYSLSNDAQSISYSAGTSTTLTKVSGVKSAGGLSVSGKVVTVAAASLNKSKVSITGDGYKLALANDVSTAVKAKTAWSYKSSVATLSQTKGAYYSLASNGKSISYSAATNKNLAKLSGVKSADGISVSGKVITVPNSIIKSDRKVSVNGTGYNFNFTAQKTLITGSKNADIITSTGANSTINGGKGNDSINISGANNVIVYKNGDGKDTITNYSEDDTIKITSGAAQVTTSGSNVVFNVGNGSMILKDAANKTVSYVNASGVAKTFSASPSEPYTIAGKGVTLLSSYSEKIFDVSDIDNGNKLVTIDASAVNRGLNLTGNDNDNKILGGAGKDTLDGFTGDDTLTGGAGADIFLYYEGDGDDVITDYESNDIIQITADTEVAPSNKGRDVVLNVGDSSIKISNAVKNATGITYTENGVEQDYINGEQTVVMNQKKTTVTLTKNYWKESVDFANFGKSISTVDASAITHDLSITGNDRANGILGGAGNDTLRGGKGNDTLQGGDGANLYVYNNGDGEDLIVGWGNRDSISIASGAMSGDIIVKDDTVILKIGKGKISLQGAMGEQLNYWYDDEPHHTVLSSANNYNVLEGDNFITNNNLSALVQSNAADYSLVEVQTSLPPANDLTTLTYSSKK